jgi:Domain of unknown function (DUF1905)
MAIEGEDSMRFRTYVEPPKPMRGLEVPPDVVESLGQGKRPPVTITINGHSWKSRVAIMRGRYVIQRQLGHADLGVTSVYLQGIDNTEVISAVHSRRAPTMPPSAGLM